MLEVTTITTLRGED